MKRIRNLGLAAVMALALSVTVGAGSAAASYFVAGAYPAPVEADAVEIQVESSAASIFCEVSPTSPFLPEATSVFPIEPEFTNCKWFGLGHEAVFSLNGCDLEFRPGAETIPGAFKGTLSIGPPGCGPVTLNDAFCKRSYPAQNGLAVSYQASGGVITASLNGAKIYGKTEGSPSGCAGGADPNLYAKWTFTSLYGLDLAQTAPGQPVGFFVSGEGSESEANQPRFDAEAFPAELSGSESENHLFTVPGPGGLGKPEEVLCYDVDTSAAVTAATSQLALEADYGQCFFANHNTSLEAELPGSIEMNSCHYTVDLLNNGPPYQGDVGVACTAEGDAIEVTGYASAQNQAEGKPLCEWRIAPQSGLAGASLANFGQEHSRGVSVDFGLTGVAVTKTVGSIANCGKANPILGTYSGDTSLTGILG